MIRVNEVTKYFGERVAVDRVSFTVNKGEIMGFLGPNGAGKTTTMRIITGFMPPTDGTVEINGLDVFEHPYEVKRIIGYMPEHPPLYLEMTVDGYLRFAAELRGLRGKDVSNAVKRVTDICGIGDVRKRLVGNLSKGYRQRVGLAQALVHDPEVLVLDEPTVGLDPRQIVEIRQLIKELGKDKTVILSTHILQEVTTVCESVTIINNGKIVVSDRIENLTKRFSEGGRVFVRIRHPENLDIERLKDIDGVEKVEIKEKDQFEVLFKKEAEQLLEKISDVLFDMRVGVVEFKPFGLTLEEVFIKAVSEDIRYVN
jgi:ABC-2 type transport system ATP-binding protein